jgi:molecular chaperone GrpE
MRKKIEVTSDEWREADTPPSPAPDGEAPEFGDHVNPPDPQPGDPQGGTAETGSVGGTEAYITALQADLVDARREIEDLKKQVLYAQAEFQNFRRRKEDEQKDLARFANAELIKGLLPILDNFDRALQAAEQSRNFDALVGGISGTSKQLQTFLQKAGVTPIAALGTDFDPKFHEAIGHAEDTEYAPNSVAEEVQRGYLMHDRVLRPALVRVAQG